MAVTRHLGFYRIGNSAIRSAFPENPNAAYYVTVSVDTPRDASLSAGERDASPLLFYFIILG